MSSFMRISSTSILVLLQLIGGCTRSSNSKVANGTAQDKPPSGPTSPFPTDVIPPVPVTGSFLTSELLEKDGGQFANVTVSLLAFSTATVDVTGNPPAPRVLYSTTTDANGYFRAPVEKIESTRIELKIQTQERIIVSEFVLPPDLALSVSKARVGANLQPLKDLTSSGNDKALAIDQRKLVLQVPENRAGVFIANSPQSPFEEAVSVVPFSVPIPSESQPKTKKWSALTTSYNASTENSARFFWEDTFTDAAKVRIVFSPSEISLSQWDGLIESTPQWPGHNPNENVVADYSQCNDSSYSAGSGSLSSASGSKCGISRTIFPLNSNENVYARIVSESAGEIKLSPVFVIEALNTAPTVTPVANIQGTEDTAMFDVALSIGDQEDNLTCSSALTVRSGNTLLLPNRNIYISGIGTNCKLTLVPSADQSGTSMINVSVSDGSLSAETNFLYTVAPVNDPPSLAAIASPQTTSINNSKALNLVANDPDGPLNCSTENFAYASSNFNVVAETGAVVWGGNWPNCTAIIAPVATMTGISEITVTVSDGVFTASQTFTFSVLKTDAPVTLSGWYQEAYVKAANAGGSDHFGSSVSLSGDTLAVGAPREDSNQTTITNGSGTNTDNSLSDSGAVYVYKRTGNAWAQEAFLKSANATASHGFGGAVTLSGDTLAVAGTAFPVGVFVYKRTGSTWAQEAYVMGANAASGDYFGMSVSLSGDTLAVGANEEDSNQTTITNGTTTNPNNSLLESGAVYVYKRTGISWAQEAFIKAANAGSGDFFGFSVSLSGDTLAVGAQKEDSNQNTITNGTSASSDDLSTDSGAVYVYRRTGSTWRQEAYVKAANAGTNDLFGGSVSVSGDTLAVGATNESSKQNTITNGTTASADNSASWAGAVYVYRRTGSVWAQEAFVKTVNARGSQTFGESVSLSGDTLAVTSIRESSSQTTITNGTTASFDTSKVQSGALYIYKRTGNLWEQEAYVKPANADANEFYGHSVSISGDTVAVGSDNEDSNQITITNGATASPDNSRPDSGAVYIYRRSGRLFDPIEVVASSSSSASFDVTWRSENTGTANGTVKVVYGTTEPAAQCSSGTLAFSGTAGSASVTSGLVPGTTYFVRVCSTDGSNWSQGTVSRVMVVPSISTAPTVTSIVRGTTTNPVPFDVNRIDFVVSFSDEMTEILPSNFTLTKIGGTGVPAGVVDQIYCSGSSCVVWAIPSASGDLRLDLSSPSGIRDRWGNPLGGAFTGTGVYTVTSRWQQEAYVKATNANANDFFGSSVSLSGDTLAVGADDEDSIQSSITNSTTASSDNSIPGSGAVYVYKRTGNTWSQEAYVKTSNKNVDDHFGISVSLSGDTLAVGAVGEDSSQTTITNGTGTSSDNSATDSGAVYLYKRTVSTWAREAYVKAANAGAGDNFGVSVSLSGDTLAAAANLEDSNQSTITNGTSVNTDNSATDSGVVYIYGRTGNSWAQEAFVKAANANTGDFFGTSVSLSGDTLAVGTPQEDSNQITITNGAEASADNSITDSGAVYVYRRTGSTWAQEAFVKAANAGASDLFGASVSLSGDTLAVGAPKEDSGQRTITNGPGASPDNSKPDSGAVYIYRRMGSNWAQEAFVKAANASNSNYFGSSVSLSGDTLAVGSYREQSNQTTITNGTTASSNSDARWAGAVYVYKRTGSSWSQEAYVKATNAEAGDYFGHSVSLSGDSLAVAADQEESNQTTITNDINASVDNSLIAAGAVYVYRYTGRMFDPDLLVSAKTQTSISFTWNSNLGNTTMVKVAPVASGSGTPALNCNDAAATTLPAGTTAYTYSGLTAGTKYGFRFCAWDGSNASGGSTIWEDTSP
ncbi:MAG: FG-GAP repeat protein [Silvanigrellaceae bacterium]